jgi:hypothetical protein
LADFADFGKILSDALRGSDWLKCVQPPLRGAEYHEMAKMEHDRHQSHFLDRAVILSSHMDMIEQEISQML